MDVEGDLIELVSPLYDTECKVGTFFCFRGLELFKSGSWCSLRTTSASLVMQPRGSSVWAHNQLSLLPPDIQNWYLAIQTTIWCSSLSGMTSKEAKILKDKNV